jgi:hypothetical protein
MPTPPLVPITLDKPRHFCLDIPALERAEEALIALSGKDLSIFEVLSGAQLMRLRNLRYIVWAALLYEDPGLAPSDVGPWLHMGNLAEVVEALRKCMELSQPAPNGHGGTPDDRPLDSATTGSGSGPSDALNLASVMGNTEA